MQPRKRILAFYFCTPLFNIAETTFYSFHLWVDENYISCHII